MATTDTHKAKTKATIQQHGEAIRNLEIQLGQLATIVNGKPSGYLPINIESPTIESTKGNVQVKAIGLKDGKQIDSDEKKGKVL